MIKAPAKTKLLLVDYENVQQLELAKLDDGFRIIIFVGASQKNIPIELVTTAQKLGDRVEWRRISGDGRNALDFFIAWHLGRIYEQSPRPDCIVLSRDKGFDPLLRYLNSVGMKCRRVDDQLDLPEDRPLAPRRELSNADDPNLKRVIELLGKSAKRSRPRKRRTLAQAISAMFQKKLTRPEIDGIIDSMFAKKLMSEAHGIITYEF